MEPSASKALTTSPIDGKQSSCRNVEITFACMELTFHAFHIQKAAESKLTSGIDEWLRRFSRWESKLRWVRPFFCCSQRIFRIYSASSKDVSCWAHDLQNRISAAHNTEICYHMPTAVQMKYFWKLLQTQSLSSLSLLSVWTNFSIVTNRREIKSSVSQWVS